MYPWSSTRVRGTAISILLTGSTAATWRRSAISASTRLTGEVVQPADIVKGYQYEKGRYVTLDEDDFRLANPKATQTVEIVTFVAAGRFCRSFSRRRIV